MKVLTNGVFDLLHVGHLKTLKEASEWGLELFVAVDTDERVKALKGDSRPIIGQYDRVEMLRSLSYVDHVRLFNSQQELFDIIKEYQPDYYVKAGYSLETLDQGERRFLESLQVEIVFLKTVERVSTSKIIKKINENVH